MTDKSIIDKAILIVTGVSTFFAMVSLFSMMLLITLDVILNKLIGRPIPGTIEITSYYFMVLVVFLTFPSIEKNQSHISADFIISRFNLKIRNTFDYAGKILTIGFYSLLSYAALRKAVQSTQQMETVMSNFTFYIWPARWAVIFGIGSAIIIIVLVIIQKVLKPSMND